MSFKFCDSFDAYGATSDMARKWTTVSSAQWSSTAGRYGGGAFGASGSGYNQSLTQSVSVASGATFYAAFSLSIGNANATNSTYPVLAINGLTALFLSTSGQLVLCNNNTTALASSASISNTGTTAYHWVEFSLTMNGTTSTATLYIDGISQFSGTYSMSAFAAAAITSATFGFGYVFGGANWMDDVIIWSSEGSTFNTFPLGPRRIGLVNPNGAGASTQFTPSAGANYSCVSQAYSGAAYVSDTGTGNTDTYAQSALAYTPGSNINAIVVNMYALNPAGDSTKSLATKLRSSGTVVSGTSRVLPPSAATFQDVYVADSTSAAWTVTTVNAAQMGIGD